MNESLPEAYKTGTKEFYGREFSVSPSVLIPRPETEQLIDEVLLLAGKSYLPGMKSPERRLSDRPRIIDVGTGSGCIAITLKLEIPEVDMIALDISENALKVARKNADELHADIDFIGSDLLANYHGEEPEVIVANLPYVDESWNWLDRDSLSHEPDLALYAKDGGLALIKKLLDQINERDWNSTILLEADPCQHEAIIKYAKNRGFNHLKTNGFIINFSGQQFYKLLV